MSKPQPRRQFRCTHPGCPKAFNRRDYLERHATNHLPVKPYSCTLCHRDYSRKDLYDNHLNTKVHAKSVQDFKLKQEPKASESCEQEQQQINDAYYNQIHPQRCPGPSSQLLLNERLESSMMSMPPSPANVFNAAQDNQFLPNSQLGFIMNSSWPSFSNSYPPFSENERLTKMGKFSQNGMSLGLSSLSSASGSEGSVPFHVKDKKSSENISLISEWIESDLANNAKLIGPLRDSSYSGEFKPAKSNVSNQLKNMGGTTDGDTTGTLACDDPRYDWFFDDQYPTNRSKMGYDRCYSETFIMCNERQEFYQRTNDIQPNSLTNIYDMELRPDVIASIVDIIHEIPEDLENLNIIKDWIVCAWTEVESIRSIIHKPTFDPNTCHPALLAVLCLIGMSLSSDEHVTQCAKKAYVSTFVSVYDAFVQNPPNIDERITLFGVNRLQALCLVLRFEKLFMLGANDGQLLSKTKAGKYATDLFLWLSLLSLPHAGNFGNSTVYKPVWASINKEGYMFHSGVEPNAQWGEWVLIESAKRAIHFALYCDSIATLSTSKPNPVSIFNMDIYMVCADPLWFANSADEFFYVNGPSNIITDVPYLGLIKSLIRFPRAARFESIKPPTTSTERQEVVPSKPKKELWGLFALKVVAHGLIMIVGKLSGLVTKGDEMLDVLANSRAKPTENKIFTTYDRNLLSRLYRGLDVWYHYFSAAYGDVTGRILCLDGSFCMPIKDEFEFDFTQQDDDKSTPQYALIIVLCHYSSFIFVHEDLPVVIQASTSLRSWIEKEPFKSKETLLAHLYIPLYTKWIRTYEAKGLVNACILYLAWTHAIAGEIQSGTHLFLSAVIYISAIVIWLYDFAYDVQGTNSQYSLDTEPLNLHNFQFMDDAIQYLHEIYQNASGSASTPRKRNLKSVLLLSACLLYKRTGTLTLVKSLIEMLKVMDPEHSGKEFADVIKNSVKYYETRASECRTQDSRFQKQANDDNDSEHADSMNTDLSDDVMLSGASDSETERMNPNVIITQPNDLIH